MRRIITGITKENPLFVLLLGLCPALAVTHTFESAYLMGFCVIFVLLFSNLVIATIKKIVPENVKIPVFIIIIATFVTTVDMLIKEFIPDLHATFGIYLPLITVNCLVLGRAIAVASKEKVLSSLHDAIGIGLGFTITISAIAFVREVLAHNTITIMGDLSNLTGYKWTINVLPVNLDINVFATPAGAFLAAGFLLALFNKFILKEAHDESN